MMIAVMMKYADVTGAGRLGPVALIHVHNVKNNKMVP